MAGQRLSGFGGMVPLVSSRLLPPNNASAAVNVHLRGGEIRGIRQPAEIKNFTAGGPPAYKKAFRIPDPSDAAAPVWVPFTSRHGEMWPNPLANDVHNRFVILDGNSAGTATAPQLNSLSRIKSASPALLLGVPPPVLPLGLTVAGGSGIIVTRAYVYTYVNIFGEEGSPSPAITLSGFANGSWNLTGIVNPTFVTTRGIATVRIYRTISGTTGAAFFFVATQAVTTATYSDTALDSVLAAQNIQLQSASWAPPVNLEGIVPMPNGFFAGWTRNQIYFSEAYRPWAWPAEYGLATEYNILRCGVVGQTLVVVTTAMPVLVTGVAPASMTMAKLPTIEPCVSANSVVAAAEGVYYASKNGLVLVSSLGLTLLTKNMIGRDEWNTSYIPKINAAVTFDSQYVVVGFEGDGFVYDLRETTRGVIGLDRLKTIDNIWTDPYTAEAHMMAENIVYTWSLPTAPFVTAEWASKDFHYERQINVGAVVVYFDPAYPAATQTASLFLESLDLVGDPWTDKTSIVNYNRINGLVINGAPAWGSAPPNNPAATVWPFWPGVKFDLASADLPDGVSCVLMVFAGQSLVWQSNVVSGRPYRLPSGFKSDTWRLQIKTRVPVLSIQFAETMKGLRLV